MTRRCYQKPKMTVHEIAFNGIICTSPNLLFYEGGGGTYGEDTTLDNGDD